MKVIIKIYIIILLTVFLSCNCKNNNVQGLYHLGPGLFGSILQIFENDSLQLFSYSDLGGIWYRFDGIYKVTNDIVILNIIRPETDSTYSIEIDSLYVRKFNDLEFMVSSLFVKEFDNSIKITPEKWYYKTNQKPYKGNGCYLKVGERLTLDSLTGNKIIWDYVNRKNMKFEGHWVKPPPPKRPLIVDSVRNDDLDSLINEVSLE